MCANCGARGSSVWRAGNAGLILCNACGMFYSKHDHEHRPEHLISAARAKAAERARNMLTARVGAESVVIKRASTDGKALPGIVTAAAVAEAPGGAHPPPHLPLRQANAPPAPTRPAPHTPRPHPPPPRG